jgi:hypothetical protein
MQGPLFGPYLIGRLGPMALPQLRRIIEIGELGEPLAKSLYGLQVPKTKRLLL